MTRADFPKAARLRLRGEFSRIMREGRVYPGVQCVVRIRPNEHACARLGIAAPRKYGNAIRRNRFKRLVRAAFREVQASLGAVDVFVAPRRGLVQPELGALRRDLVAAPENAHAPSRRRRR